MSDAAKDRRRTVPFVLLKLRTICWKLYVGRFYPVVEELGARSVVDVVV